MTVKEVLAGDKVPFEYPNNEVVVTMGRLCVEQPSNSKELSDYGVHSVAKVLKVGSVEDVAILFTRPAQVMNCSRHVFRDKAFTLWV